VRWAHRGSAASSKHAGEGRARAHARCRARSGPRRRRRQASVPRSTSSRSAMPTPASSPRRAGCTVGARTMTASSASGRRALASRAQARSQVAPRGGRRWRPARLILVPSTRRQALLLGCKRARPARSRRHRATQIARRRHGFIPDLDACSGGCKSHVCGRRRRHGKRTSAHGDATRATTAPYLTPSLCCLPFASPAPDVSHVGARRVPLSVCDART
jgi:hypothetical protein